jgi:hypothetical protein
LSSTTVLKSEIFTVKVLGKPWGIAMGVKFWIFFNLAKIMIAKHLIALIKKRLLSSMWTQVEN